MANTVQLDREEYIEQAYFFRCFRDRLTHLTTQQILGQIHEELLVTTRIPLAIQFLGTDLKHTGLLSSGFERLGHYFTKFQTYVMRNSEEDDKRFTLELALLILEREATYRAERISQAGLFMFQLEAISRNRLGYDSGFQAMAYDPFYDEDWQAFVQFVRKNMGVFDLTDLIYLRSEMYVKDQQRDQPDYSPPLPAWFLEKEGRIAKANRGRDPLYFFAALQRQLGYPEVPRPKPRDNASLVIDMLQTKIRELENRLRLLESEVKGQVDLSQFAKPEILQQMERFDEP